MKKLLLLGALAPALFAEISAFDAGNVDLANPYGLTASEKAALKNKQHLEGLSKEYAGVDFKTTKALERIDGLQSLIDDLGTKNHNLETKLNDFEEFINTKEQARVSEMAKLKSMIYSNSKEIAALKKAIAELLDMIEQGEKPKPHISANTPNANLSPAARQKSALAAFESGDYQSAAAEFEALVAMKHKPAMNSYYLAECFYEQGDYERAIYYFKNSNDSYKAQGVKPLNEAKVLLHTGLSLQKLNQGPKAKMFFDALKQKFPNSAEAKSIK